MKFIIPIIVGAAIGYGTNWLAIKMLFRPHYEKRIMGVKIPFTPGLIPKEKGRIAKNIGETVGGYLLSPTTIAETLGSPRANREMENWIRDKIDKLQDDEGSIGELLFRVFGNRYEEIVKNLEKTSHTLLINLIRSEDLKEKILSLIRGKLYDDKIYEDMEEGVRLLLDRTLKSERLEIEIKEKIEGEIRKISRDGRILKDALPEKIKWEIDLYLDENIEEIGDNLRRIIKSPNIQDKLKGSISNIVDQNVSKLITSFIPREAISEKIYLAIENYIEDENWNKDVLILIKSLLDRVMEGKVSGLTSGVLARLNPEDISKVILGYLNKVENKEILAHMINERIKEIDPEIIVEKLWKEIDQVLRGERLERDILFFIEEGISEILNRPITGILDQLEGKLPTIYDYSKIGFDNLLIKELPGIIELFNVSKIVEDEINKFDVKFTEELILDIASKELRAITRLGALLGGIMGLLSPLLQML